MKNELAAAKGLPAWLDGQTVAIAGMVLTAVIGLGALIVASSSATRAHIDTRFDELDTRFDELILNIDTRFDEVIMPIDGLDHGLNARIDGLSVRIDGFDRRLTAVQVGVAEIRGHLGLPSAVGWQGRKAATATPPDATPEPRNR